MSRPAARGDKGWDGKLRLSDINGQDRSASEDESEDEEGADEAAGGTLQANGNGNSPRTAVVQQGETVEGAQIEADEDLMTEFEDDIDEIELSHCRIASIQKLGLERFTHLNRLGLRQNAISRVEFPSNVHSTLRELDLYDNLIKHIASLDGFTQLESLDLSFNKIKRIEGVSHLKTLKDLYFVQDRISKIENLEGLDSLRNLELGGNRIRTVENLETLTNLKELWLGKNKITEITGLSRLSNLTILSIQANRIQEISGLEGLTSLEELHISHNAITRIGGLSQNTKLRVIDISQNPISKLEGLEALEELEELWASGCRFESFGEVEQQLRNKTKLSTVYFEATPLQLKQPALYRNKVRLALPQLKQIDATFLTGAV